MERLHINAPIAQPPLSAPLPAGGKAPTQWQWQRSVPMVEKNGLAQQEPAHHSGQGIQVAIVSEAAVLTEEGEQLSMAPGAGIHTGLVWCENPKLSQLPALVMT
jgi:hypothetical protein